MTSSGVEHCRPRLYNFDIFTISRPLLQSAGPPRKHPFCVMLPSRVGWGKEMRTAPRSGFGEGELPFLVDVDADPISLPEAAFQELQSQRGLDLLLDRPLERPRTVNRGVAVLGEKLSGLGH